MKRFWIGVTLLVVLMAVGIFATWGINHCHDPIAQEIRRAGEAAWQENWEQAETLAAHAQKGWKKYWNLSASLSDHEPMERIDGLFAQLEVYGQARERVNYAAVCAQLGEELEAIGDAHSFVWWNLL